jgi:hypothetical protein
VKFPRKSPAQSLFYQCTESDGGTGVTYTDFAREAIGVQHHLQKIASAVGLAASAVLMLALTTGTGVAGAATRTRSGAVHAELASHVSGAAAANASSSLTLTGPTVMASIVALMAFSAFAFIVVTLIRRRSTAA